jgi:hypothetical protein
MHGFGRTVKVNLSAHMGLTMVLWLCSLVPLVALALPRWGVASTALIVLVLLFAFVLLCWITCAVRVMQIEDSASDR